MKEYQRSGTNFGSLRRTPRTGVISKLPPYWPLFSLFMILSDEHVRLGFPEQPVYTFSLFMLYLIQKKLVLTMKSPQYMRWT